jgi:hypothetical protein
LVQTAARLLFPALIVDRGGVIQYRNRLAEKLLPSSRRLHRFLIENGESLSKTGIFTSALEDEHYFVIRLLEENDAFLIGFLEHFLPFYEPLARLVLERSQKLFWELEPERMLPFAHEGDGRNSEYLDLVAARMISLRQEEGLYLRFASLRSREIAKPSSCSISGFFRHLKEVLKRAKLDFELNMQGEAKVWVSTQTLSFAVLNLIQFGFLYAGETRPEISVQKGEDSNEISFSFSSRSDWMEDCFFLLSGKGCSEKAIFLSPLLCVAAICGEEGVEMRVEKSDENFLVTLFFPKADHMPDSFLSDVASAEKMELEKMVREIFF